LKIVTETSPPPPQKTLFIRCMVVSTSHWVLRCSQGEDNSATHSGDGNAANSGFVVSEKLAKAINAARKSDAARKCDAGISDAASKSEANKSTPPTLVPQPVAHPANPKAKKKQETEPDAVPSATYKSILAAKLNKITPPPIPGTGKATANLDCGSFYNTGDNRIRRAVYKENVATLTVSSISFNPVTWDCSSCPVKHPILGGGEPAEGGGEGRPVIILTDQNFPAILPTATGNCLAIIRIEHGSMRDLTDMLLAISPETIPEGTVFLLGSLTQLQNEGLQGYSSSGVRYGKKIAGIFKNTTVVLFIPPPPWAG
jgi:hypothetical protein